ncbi:MAG: MFS transporter [Verrucomicrobia bacterium]|nr:MFS transporter [Verrucomicrobiota bacterium]
MQSARFDAQDGLWPAGSPARAYMLLSTLVLAYVGVYLCRKNLSVVVPMLQSEWGLAKEEVGVVASVSTVAYAVGKVVFGPVVDRLGGRVALLLSMGMVALFGATGAFAPGLGFLVGAYSTNRLAGSASWGSMVKLVPDWFPAGKLAFAYGLLSLSYVFGGALALAFAGFIAARTADNWRWVLGVPSVVLAVLLVLTWLVLPQGGAVGRRAEDGGSSSAGLSWSGLRSLLGEPQLHIVCALSFTLTFMREAFNFWTVDYLKSEGGPELSSSVAAMLSTPFDACGALGIVALGWVFGRLCARRRRWLLCAVLGTLSVLLLALPAIARVGLWAVSASVGLVGFLVYGPYSLLAGVLAVEVRGKEAAATVAGLVDGTGYLAGILSGSFFGWLLTRGGYPLGFQFMAAITVVSAFLCLRLYARRP